MKTWSAEDVMMLCVYVSVGDLSAGDIGIKLGKPRNAVIGKIKRLGLKGPRFGQAKPPSRIKRVPAPIRVTPPEINPSQVDPPVVPAEPAVIASTIPISRRVSIMGLGACMCRFILGDARDGVYCGSPTSGGPWCPGHREIVSQPPLDNPYRIPRWGRPARPAEQLEEVGA